MVAVAVSRLLVPVLPQAEELAAMDLLVMEFVPMAPVAPSLAGVEPALSIAVVVVVAVVVAVAVSRSWSRSFPRRRNLRQWISW